MKRMEEKNKRQEAYKEMGKSNNRFLTIIFSIFVIGLFLWIVTPILYGDENASCPIKEESIKLDMDRSIEHRSFCLEKNLSPVYPNRTMSDCSLPYCYQRSLFVCSIDMDKEVWCYDENNEIRRFSLE